MKILIRAKTINQDFKEETESLKKINGNWYAVGFENPCVQKEFQGIKLCAIVGEDLDAHICDYSTRSIHFEDMLDSEINKIFASLSEDGKGGDICICYLRYKMNNIETKRQEIVKYIGLGDIFPFNHAESIENKSYSNRYDEFKVIGIQE